MKLGGDIPLHDHPVEPVQPIITALPEVVVNRNRKLCLLQPMLYFYHQLLVVDLKPGPDVLCVHCFYCERGCLVWISI